MPEAAKNRAAAIVVAGGTGERFGAPGGKQLAVVGGMPVLSHTLRALEAAGSIGLIVVVCHPERIDEYRRVALEPLGLGTPYRLVAGGDSRTESVKNGLEAIGDEWQFIVVHDGARPLATPDIFAAVVEALAARPDLSGVVIGQPSSDTIKEVEAHRIVGTPDRSRYWLVQTPQVFRAPALRAAYARSTPGAASTDDAAMVESNGGLVDVLEGPRDNVKVTLPEDLDIIAAVLRHRGEG